MCGSSTCHWGNNSQHIDILLIKYSTINTCKILIITTCTRKEWAVTVEDKEHLRCGQYERPRHVWPLFCQCPVLFELGNRSILSGHVPKLVHCLTYHNSLDEWAIPFTRTPFREMNCTSNSFDLSYPCPLLIPLGRSLEVFLLIFNW